MLSLGLFGFLPAAALLHNVVHLIIGVAALVASGANQWACWFLTVGGIA